MLDLNQLVAGEKYVRSVGMSVAEVCFAALHLVPCREALVLGPHGRRKLDVGLLAVA